MAALAAEWSTESSSLWTKENPSKGQCGVTSLVVQDVFGGDILKTDTDEGIHFYNLIDGVRMDFTLAQFQAPIAYDDQPATRVEAMNASLACQYDALRLRLGLCVKDWRAS